MKKAIIISVIGTGLILLATLCKDDIEEILENIDNNNAKGLMADVPTLTSFKYMCENNCWDGVHRYYTTTGNADEVMNNYKVALTDEGWTIEDSGGSIQGAGLEASMNGKYLDFNIGGDPAATMHIDLSVWPAEPEEKNCDHCKVTGGSDGGGSSGGDNPNSGATNLMGDLPVIANFLFQCENNCGDGLHRYYITSGSPTGIASDYAAKLVKNGWKIEDGPGGGSYGAGLEASKNGKYLDMNVGGYSNSKLNVDVSVWPSEPANKDCPNCEVSGGGKDSGGGTDPDDNPGGGGDLLSDVPNVYGLSPVSSNDCNGGKHFYYQTSSSPQDVVPDYKTALEQKGWTVSYNGSGSTWGWGLTATKGGKYLYMNIGGFGTMNIDLCVWPSQPADTDCDQDCDD